MALPARGSLQDKILQEAIERERYAQYKQTVFTGRTMALALRGANEAAYTTLEEELSLAIFQTAFDPEQLEAQMKRLRTAARQHREELLRDARMLQKVATYSVDGDEDERTNEEHSDVFERRINKGK